METGDDGATSSSEVLPSLVASLFGESLRKLPGESVEPSELPDADPFGQPDCEDGSATPVARRFEVLQFATNRGKSVRDRDGHHGVVEGLSVRNALAECPVHGPRCRQRSCGIPKCLVELVKPGNEFVALHPGRDC